MEEFRTSPSFPRFKVYPDGSIIGPSGRTLAPMVDSDGYQRISIYLGASKWKRVGVHFVVCEAFHGPRPDDKPLVAHADGNPSNNFSDNLRWASFKENESDKRRHGRTLEGSRHHQAKLKEAQVIEIRSRATRGESRASLAREYGITDTQISRIVLRKSWRHI